MKDYLNKKNIILLVFVLIIFFEIKLIWLNQYENMFDIQQKIKIQKQLNKDYESLLKNKQAITIEHENSINQLIDLEKKYNLTQRQDLFIRQLSDLSLSSKIDVNNISFAEENWACEVEISEQRKSMNEIIAKSIYDGQYSLDNKFLKNEMKASIEFESDLDSCILFIEAIDKSIVNEVTFFNIIHIDHYRVQGDIQISSIDLVKEIEDDRDDG